jgi:hypothetical protein
MNTRDVRNLQSMRAAVMQQQVPFFRRTAHIFLGHSQIVRLNKVVNSTLIALEG